MFRIAIELYIVMISFEVSFCGTDTGTGTLALSIYQESIIFRSTDYMCIYKSSSLTIDLQCLTRNVGMPSKPAGDLGLRQRIILKITLIEFT